MSSFTTAAGNSREYPVRFHFDFSVARIHPHPLTIDDGRVDFFGGVEPLRPLLDPIQHLIPTASAAAAGVKSHVFQYSKCTGKRKALCVRPDSVRRGAEVLTCIFAALDRDQLQGHAERALRLHQRRAQRPTVPPTFVFVCAYFLERIAVA